MLTGTDAKRNIFDVTAEQWSGSQRDWIFDVPAGSKIIVNVRGDSVELSSGRMVIPEGVTEDDVLVNYVILEAVTGAVVTVTQTISNPTSFTLRSVAVTCPDGSVVPVADLNPGDSVTLTTQVSSEAIRRETCEARVFAYVYDANGAAFEARSVVEDCDVAVIEFTATGSDGVGGGSSAEGTPSVTSERADLAIDEGDMWFSCLPTFAGETFTVNVRITQR